MNRCLLMALKCSLFIIVMHLLPVSILFCFFLSPVCSYCIARSRAHPVLPLSYLSLSLFLTDVLSLHWTIRLPLTPLLSCLQHSRVTPPAFPSVARSLSPAVKYIHWQQCHLLFNTSTLKMHTCNHKHQKLCIRHWSPL